MSEGTHKDAQHFRIVWQINWQIITINLSLLGPAFASWPDKITITTTGSNQTFTWKLHISQEHKEWALRVQFGPWNRSYKLVFPIITLNQKLSGSTTVSKSPENRKSRRLYWAGDLKRDRYIAFQLVNIQRDDAGDYGVKLRVDNYPRRPLTLNRWFTLKVEVRKKLSYNFFLHCSIEACKKMNYRWFSLLTVPIQFEPLESVHETHIVRHRILLCSDNQTICTLLSDR